jgi:hypothetical protein
VCPECGQYEGHNVGDENWIVCHQHRVRWIVGNNLFSIPEEVYAEWQTRWEETRQERWDTIRDYTDLTHERLDRSE